MPRGPRVQPGSMICHALNRGNQRRCLFEADADHAAFLRVLVMLKRPMRLPAYCLTPNHWHLLLWPSGDGDLRRCMQRLTITHARHWRQRGKDVKRGNGVRLIFPRPRDPPASRQINLKPFPRLL